jgi:cytochrome c oxidase subunit 3
VDAASATTLDQNLPKTKRSPRLPQDTRSMQGIWLFLIALSVFFFSSILLYVVYVALRVSPEMQARPLSFRLPRSFVPSTVLLIGVSASLEWALRAAIKDRIDTVKRATLAALVMGLLFMAVQSEGMYRLIAASNQAISSRTSIYSLTFVLAFLHALHVVGGVVALVSTTMQSYREKYDHERSIGLRFCTLYWHFLDIVWVFLIASFLIAGWLVNTSAG